MCVRFAGGAFMRPQSMIGMPAKLKAMPGSGRPQRLQRQHN
jgi:hypothetical protein